jgi:Flp pilus assembly protein TadG
MPAAIISFPTYRGPAREAGIRDDGLCLATDAGERGHTGTIDTMNVGVDNSKAVPARQHCDAQRGAAAIEFALVLSIFLIMISGIVGVGALLWAQQTLTSAATEGARALLDSSLQGAADTASGCVVARDAASWMSVQCTVTPQTCAWTLANGTAAQCVAIELKYDTAGWPLLTSMAALAAGFGGNWMPSSLSAHAMVQIQEPS